LSDILADLAAHASLEVVARTDPSLLRDDEVMEIVGSHDKLTEATGWRPEVEQSKMLLDTLDWWREHLAVGATG
jgi:nucleoside-diphosphate-sugar epimerase